MRPEDRRSRFDDLMDSGMDLPFDADLETLDRELTTAGEQARRMLYGRTQPTRVFSNELRARLLGGAVNPAIDVSPQGSVVASLGKREPETWSMAARDASPASRMDERQAAAQGSTTPPRVLLALLAILAMAGVLAMSALGGSLGPTLP